MIAWWLDTGVPQTGPVAVFEANQVIACSPDARAEGVYLGQRRREAQSRCPQLQVVAASVQRDEQIFTPLVVMIERSVPKVQVIRPGLAALRVRGPARYYGGEPEVAKAVLSGINELGVTGGRVGIADDIFTAEQAARDTQ
ncbi:MAG: DNA polymerase Y family protein, partial [Propionibacterium sp.]|nr:DNA polymerase Y family protein [Propionibacterium sp.]